MQAGMDQRPRALVTGASAGIGQAFAERLAQDGYDLILVARRRARLEALAERLQADSSAEVTVLVADLTEPDQLRSVERTVAEDARLDLLINNAGFPGYMPFVELDPDRAEELIRLHIVAVTRLTRAALPGMIARGHGAVVNLSSLLGFSGSVPGASPLPKRVVYAACKSYLNTFSQVLHNELEGTGVQVQALCPGFVRGTEFHDDVPGFDRSRHAGARLDAQSVVQASLAGLRLGEVICVPGLDDPALVERVGAAERELLGSAGRAGLAQRYADTPSL